MVLKFLKRWVMLCVSAYVFAGDDIDALLLQSACDGYRAFEQKFKMLHMRDQLVFGCVAQDLVQDVAKADSLGSFEDRYASSVAGPVARGCQEFMEAIQENPDINVAILKLLGFVQNSNIGKRFYGEETEALSAQDVLQDMEAVETFRQERQALVCAVRDAVKKRQITPGDTGEDFLDALLVRKVARLIEGNAAGEAFVGEHEAVLDYVILKFINAGVRALVHNNVEVSEKIDDAIKEIMETFWVQTNLVLKELGILKDICSYAKRGCLYMPEFLCENGAPRYMLISMMVMRPASVEARCWRDASVRSLVQEFVATSYRFDDIPIKTWNSFVEAMRTPEYLAIIVADFREKMNKKQIIFSHARSRINDILFREDSWEGVRDQGQEVLRNLVCFCVQEDADIVQNIVHSSL